MSVERANLINWFSFCIRASNDILNIQCLNYRYLRGLLQWEFEWHFQSMISAIKIFHCSVESEMIAKSSTRVIKIINIHIYTKRRKFTTVSKLRIYFCGCRFFDVWKWNNGNQHQQINRRNLFTFSTKPFFPRKSKFVFYFEIRPRKTNTIIWEINPFTSDMKN